MNNAPEISPYQTEEEAIAMPGCYVNAIELDDGGWLRVLWMWSEGVGWQKSSGWDFSHYDALGNEIQLCWVCEDLGVIVEVMSTQDAEHCDMGVYADGDKCSGCNSIPVY